jgi:hypothetical protein
MVAPLPVLRVATLILGFSSLVAGLGSTCSSPLGAGTSGPNDPFWMETIKHQGKAPFNPNPNGYKVFRNVKVRRMFLLNSLPSSYNLSKDYGAVGDGVHDDTAAIKLVFFFNFPSPYSPRRLPAPRLLTKADVEVDLVNLQRREFIMLHHNKI